MRTRSAGAPRARNRARISSVCARMRIRRGQHRREEPAQGPVAGKGPVGNTPVHNRQAGAGTLDLAEEVGPDLRLHDDHNGGLERAQDPAHREDVIHRRVEHAIGQPSQFFAGDGAAGQGRGGNEQAAARKLRPQPAQKTERRQHFAYRNRVQPYGSRTSPSIGARQKPEALGERPQ